MRGRRGRERARIGTGAGMGWLLAALLTAPGGAARAQSEEPSFARARARPQAAPEAAAQAAEPAAAPLVQEELAQEEEVVVTGSRVAREPLSGLGPISVLGSAELERKGAFSATELLRDLPSLGFAGSSANNTNGGRGLESVDLRSLGSARTLVLVNGRRAVQSSNGASDFVDLGSFPPALIERIDVLRDGVSTIYGADAVAGVVNLVLKQDYEGLELSLDGGVSQRGDAERGELGLLWGKNFARGNLTLSGSLSSRGDVHNVDREFSRRPILSAERGPDGRIALRRDIARARQGRVVSSTNPALDGAFFRRGADGSSFGTGYLPERDGTPINDQFVLNGELYRSSLNGLFRYDLSDSVSWFSELTYSRRDGGQDFGESSLSTNPTGLAPDGFAFEVFRPGDPRNNPYLPLDFIERAFRDRDGNPLAPGLESVQVKLNRSLAELGPREFQNEARLLRFASGVRGELPQLLGGVDWELYGNYGRSDDTESVNNEVNLARALRSVQPELCARDPRCVVGDFFGAGSLLRTPGALDYVRFKSRERLRFALREVGGTLRGDVFELPAGPLQAVLGAVYREESGFARPDPSAVSGESGGNARQPTRGRQLVREAFFETTLPILRDLPAARELALEISGRYTDYSSFGGRYLSRYGVSWQPLEALRLRGVYATAFRAPGISDLFLGQADSFQNVRDACDGFPDVRAGTPAETERLRAACAARLPEGRYSAANPFRQRGGPGTQLRTNVGGNRELQEETAHTLGLGFVLTPPAIAGLQLSADYYQIEVNHPILGRSPQLAVDRCLLEGSEPDCARTRRGPDGQLDFVDASRANLGKLQTRGLDLGLRYATPLPILGSLELDFDGSYIFGFDVTSEGGRSKQVGTIGGSFGATPEFKGRLQTLLRPTANWELGASARYIGRGKDPDRRALGLPYNRVPSITYLDLSTRYAFGPEGRYSLSFGVQNAADVQPPRLIGSLSNTSESTYDLVGRRYSLSFRGQF